MSEHTDPPGADLTAGWFPLDELTGRLAALVWVERQLGVVLGSWASSAPEAGVAVAFARAGKHHEWHASVLTEVLATSPALRAIERIGAPTIGWARATDQLLALKKTEARLAAISRLVGPWLDREIEALRELADPLRDRDHERLLLFVDIDHTNDHDELASLLDEHETAAIQLSGRREIAAIDLG